MELLREAACIVAAVLAALLAAHALAWVINSAPHGFGWF